MKKKRIIKFIISVLLLLINIVSLILLSISLFKYKGVETFYRMYIIIVLLYFLVVFNYYLFKKIVSYKKLGYIIFGIIIFIFSSLEFICFYYLNNIYNTVNNYSNNTNIYYSSLVTYNLKLDSYKDLKNKKIGIINDKSDIEGYIVPNNIIDELKLDDNNEIVSYNSTIELLNALKSNKIDAAFFSRNYIDMFYSLEGYENIENETKVLYEGSMEYEEEEEEISTSSLTEPFTILLIGVDSSNDGVTSGYNADVLLLITFNPKTLRATMTSVPRDMYLKTACSGGEYRRINTVTWGSSSSCAVETMEDIFGVDINYYAKINFKGIVELVDSVGGIDVDVDYSFCEQNSSRSWGENTVYVEKGYSHLNGEQALALARNRHNVSDGSASGDLMSVYCPTYNEGERNDYTRGRNQMKVILGILSSAMELRDPNQALDILKKIDRNFQTNIKTDDVLSLYNLAKSILVTDNTNIINVQRSQLSGYDVYGYVYDTSLNGYPAVTIPYTASINDIKKQINNNLNNSSDIIKSVSFDLNNLYQTELVGNGKYMQTKISTLKDVSSYSVSEIKTYASNNNLKLTFIDVDTNEDVTINDYTNYSFYSQKEHKDIIISQLSTLTIYVKKNNQKKVENISITQKGNAD